MTIDILSPILFDIPPFISCSDKGKHILSHCNEIEEKSFHAGETVFSDEHALCVLTEGKATVMALDGGQRVQLNQIGTNQCFGVSSLFSSDDFPTLVVAKTKCRAFFIPEGTVRQLISGDPDFAFGYTLFLTEKIRFLNSKIRAFTAPDSQGKLAVYILQNADDKGRVHIASMAGLAKKLDIGRASLYRAADALCSSGAIVRTDSEIKITDRNKLSQSTKKE